MSTLILEDSPLSLKSWEQAMGHGSHEISFIYRDDARKSRDRSRNLGLAEETKDAKHANRPLLISLTKPAAFLSSEFLDEMPNGSYRFKAPPGMTLASNGG